MVVSYMNAMPKQKEKRKTKGKKNKETRIGQPYIEKQKWCFKAIDNFYIYSD